MEFKDQHLRTVGFQIMLLKSTQANKHQIWYHMAVCQYEHIAITQTFYDMKTSTGARFITCVNP